MHISKGEGNTDLPQSNGRAFARTTNFQSFIILAKVQLLYPTMSQSIKVIPACSCVLRLLNSIIIIIAMTDSRTAGRGSFSTRAVMQLIQGT